MSSKAQPQSLLWRKISAGPFCDIYCHDTAVSHLARRQPDYARLSDTILAENRESTLLQVLQFDISVLNCWLSVH